MAVDDVADVEGFHLAEVSALRRLRLLHAGEVRDGDLHGREKNNFVQFGGTPFMKSCSVD